MAEILREAWGDMVTTMDISGGRVRCHMAVDLITSSGDLVICNSYEQYLIQKIILHFATPKGERLNKPGIGSNLRGKMFSPLSEERLYRLKKEIEYDFQNQFSDIKIANIEVKKSEAEQDSVSITIKTYTIGDIEVFANLQELNMLTWGLTNSFGWGLNV